MAILPDEIISASDFINESEIPTPQSDAEGKVVKLESDGKISSKFSRGNEIPVTLGESIDGTTTPKAVFIADGNTAENKFIDAVGSGSTSDVDIYATIQIAFIFNSSNYNRITEVSWDAISSGIGADDNLYVEIFAVTGGNLPTGSALASKVFNSTSYTTTNQSVCIFDTPVTVSKNTNYALVMRASTTDAGDFYRFYTQNTDPSGAFVTTLRTNYAGTWVADSGYPREGTYVKGYEALTVGKVYLSDDEKSAQRKKFNGFIYTSGVADDVEYMRLDYYAGFSGLTLGSKYYISTNGSVSTTGDIEVGRAISTSEISFEKDILGDDVTTLANTSNTDPQLNIIFTNSGFVFGQILDGTSSANVDITVGGTLVAISSSTALNAFCVPVKIGDTLTTGGTANYKIYFRALN